MKIDGRLIASEIKLTLKEKIQSLGQRNIIPQLAVVLIGNDPASEVYVRQKLKVGEEIGVQVSLFSLQQSKTGSDPVLELKSLIKKLNTDPLIHGIIIQRPVPINIPKEELDLMVLPQKDVDGFHPDSPFTPPIANAVLKILEYVEKDLCSNPKSQLAQNYCEPFMPWLKKQKILVIGRGETAGRPIAQTLQKMGVNLEIAHSKTENMEKLCLASDILITCVGRPDIVRHNMVNSKTILIGVGLHQEEGKLKTDYYEEEVADRIAYFTPVPGGVGPVNVACLFENLIISCETSCGSPGVVDL